MNHNDSPLNLKNQEQVMQDARRQADAEHDLEVDDLKWLMSSKRGRRIVARLLDQAGVWRTSFNTNALQMSFNEGMRNQGLRLVSAVTEHCPDRFNEMIKERK